MKSIFPVELMTSPQVRSFITIVPSKFCFSTRNETQFQILWLFLGFEVYLLLVKVFDQIRHTFVYNISLKLL